MCVDECHLAWGDALGYAWGPRDERVETPIGNDRKRQTYFGAVNLLTGRPFVMPAEAGNGDQSVSFLKRLRSTYQGRRLFILRDRAPYRRADVVKARLKDLNGACAEHDRLIHLEYFAPNAPEQNPIEDLWFAAKTWLRRHFFQFDAFAQITQRFVTFIHNFTLRTVKFTWYWEPQII